MASSGLAQIGPTAPEGVWLKVGQALRGELGEATFGSWLGQAAIRTTASGDLCLVTPTGIARDWIHRHAWRRIEELWARFDFDGRTLALKARAEIECDGGVPAQPATRVAAVEIACAEEVPAMRGGAAGCLQDRFTFETFVEGPSNEFALTVARRVSSWADGHFNPVVFYGPFGFGKTHLLQAIAWEAMQKAPAKKVVYLGAERFVASFVRSLQERKTAAFKDELRSADLLLIDDVHFMGGKQSSETELFHTLAALVEDGRRVVCSAVRPPAALGEIDARLRSHLSAGLVCGIAPADRALRLDILERKSALLARQQGIVGRPRAEVLQFLADRFTESVRELEGALNTLIVRAGPGIAAVTLEQTQALLGPALRAGAERRVSVDDIQKVTAEHFGLKQTDLISERRTRSVARPRQAAMWLAKQLTTRSLPDIGRRFGGRDHTTVLHAVRRIEALRASDPQLAEDLETLVRKLRGG